MQDAYAMNGPVVSGVLQMLTRLIMTFGLSLTWVLFTILFILIYRRRRLARVPGNGGTKQDEA
jgi:hypothetical protein